MTTEQHPDLAVQSSVIALGTRKKKRRRSQELGVGRTKVVVEGRRSVLVCGDLRIVDSRVHGHEEVVRATTMTIQQGGAGAPWLVQAVQAASAAFQKPK